MVAGLLGLLVGAVVFLVQDDEPQVRKGREDGAARPEHHADAPLADALPHREALPSAEPAVEDAHLVAQARPEAAGGLRREADLGHQHDDLLAGRQHLLDGPQIDLGLAAAGDSRQQEGREALVQGLLDFCQDPLLILIETQGLRALRRRFRFQLPRPFHGFDGQHGAQHLAQGRAVVAGHPPSQVEKGRVEPGLLVEQLVDIADAIGIRGKIGLELGGPPFAQHESEFLGAPEGHLHPRAGLGDGHVIGQAIAEGPA